MEKWKDLNTVSDLKKLFPVKDKSSKTQADLPTGILKYSFIFLYPIPLMGQKFVLSNYNGAELWRDRKLKRMGLWSVLAWIDKLSSFEG